MLIDNTTTRALVVLWIDFGAGLRLVCDLFEKIKNEILQKLQKHQKTYNYSDAVHL
jgi:hypothetical protein